MKIIELLNKIANGEQPKTIKYYDTIYNFEEYKGDWGYVNKEYGKYKWFAKEIDCDLSACLNEEVEIIEEETKPITKEGIEALGYACGEIQKCFTNGWNKSLENKPLGEDKKIEKLEVIGWNDCIHEVTHTEKRIFIEINKTQTKLNEIIDYLMENKQ